MNRGYCTCKYKQRSQKQKNGRHHEKESANEMLPFATTTTTTSRRINWRRPLLTAAAIATKRRSLSSSSTRPTTVSKKRGTPQQLRAVVALSGGVDSAVAAALLQQKDNYALTAIFMRNWKIDHDDYGGTHCDHTTDWKDAQKVASTLQNMPIRHVSFEQEYWVMVFEPYLDALQRHGRMGNPDILCNKFVKFDALRQYVREEFGEHVPLATGHYARLFQRDTTQRRRQEVEKTALSEHTRWVLDWGNDDSIPLLQCAVDHSKDQTYFLAGCHGRDFCHVLFPLGSMYKKTDTRQTAIQCQLPVANKKESMGICFVGKQRGFTEFIKEYLEEPTERVQFVDIDTKDIVATSPVPEHPYLFVEGQKARLGGMPMRYYCVGHDIRTATVFVCAGPNHPALFRESLYIRDMSWWTGHEPPSLEGIEHLMCRIRHQTTLYQVRMGWDANKNAYQVHFVQQPARAMTVGQWAVLYCGEFCLGGGPIAETGPSYHDLQKPVPLIL